MRQLFREFLELLLDRHLFQTRQLTQPGVEDEIGLDLGQAEVRDQDGLGLFLLANDADHLVDVEEDDAQAFQQVQPLLDPCDPPLRPAVQNLAAVIQEGPQAGLQPHDPRGAVCIQHVHVDREAHFQIRQLEQALHQHLGLDGAVLGLKDQADVLGRLVAHVAQQGRLLVLDQVRQRLDQARLLHLVRHLGDDDPPHAAPQVLGLPARPQPHPAPPRLIGVQNGGMALDRDAPSGEVRSRHQLHQLLGRRLGPVQQHLAGVDQFADIVRRDRGGHAHGDAGRAVGQQVGETGRQNHRLLVLIVVGGAEIDRVLIDPVQQQHGRRRQLALGVAHGRGAIAVDIAEVPLAVDQRIALGEILGQAHQGFIDRGVAVRVVSAHDLADDLGAFARRRLRVQPHLVHGVQDAPVHGLEPVPNIGKGAVGDGRQGVGQIATAEGRLHRLVDDTAAFRRRSVDRHGPANRGSEARSLARSSRDRASICGRSYAEG